MPQEEPTVFYYPGMSSFTSDGALVMRASGYEADCHWSGQHRVAPDHPDFALWCWLREGFRSASCGATPFCTEADLPMARQEYQRQHATPTPGA